MMSNERTLRLILGDQLSREISSLRDAVPDRDIILMAEVQDEATYVRHHKQKIVLVFSAMRHFAEDLRKKGYDVDYITIDEQRNTGSLKGEVQRAVQRHRPNHVVVTEPGEWRLYDDMQSWEKTLGIPVEIREDNRFLCSHDTFNTWAEGRKQLRMENFYRMMRKQTGWLMEGHEPEGGTWNYDVENRKALPKNVQIPDALRFVPDTVTQDVIALVKNRYADHIGEGETFGWAVTRKDALKALHAFIRQALPSFGDYQDAMQTGESFLFHSLLSPYINLGLLSPREVCERVLKAYADGHTPLHTAEGFIRQILGWREFMRGIYWRMMPTYKEGNYFDARRPLPDFYWTADTDMQCLRTCIESTLKNAYAHHIQRLMVTGNFALLAGINPAQVEDWYLAVYADAYEWVELPNTHGMALFADGGALSSKPYAASGAYIARMSDYCKHCPYDPKEKTGPSACPFNVLYWHFLMRHESTLKANPRMALAYRNLDRLSAATRQQIEHDARAFLQSIKQADA